MDEYSPKWCSHQRQANLKYPLDLLIERCKHNLTDPSVEHMTKIRVDITGFSKTIVNQAYTFFERRGWSVEIRQRGGIDYLEFADWCTYIDLAMKAYDNGQHALGSQMLEAAAQNLETSTFAHEVKKLALLYYRKGKQTRAEKVLRRALTTCSRLPGKADEHVANLLVNLAELYLSSGKEEKAAITYEKYVSAIEVIAGAECAVLERSLTKLSLLYCKLGQSEKAQTFYLRAIKIRSQTAIPDTAAQPATQLDFTVPHGNPADLSGIVVVTNVPTPTAL